VLQIDDESKLAELIEYDNKCFVRANSQWRRRLLARWITIPGGRSFLARSPDGLVLGFGCRRPAALDPGHQLVGPLYAETSDVAHDLLLELSRDVVGQTMWINICEPNDEAVRLVRRLDMTDTLHMLRMHQNGDPHELNQRVFAITSIDICGF
jgi:hypothetical protein